MSKGKGLNLVSSSVEKYGIHRYNQFYSSALSNGENIEDVNQRFFFINIYWYMDRRYGR